MKNISSFYFSILVITFTLFNVALGAIVRATGSGAGCGISWPSCNGELLISGQNESELIEYMHRLTSGFNLILVFLLLYIVYKYFRENTNALNFAIASALFIILEAIIGAIIVIFQWVAEDASIARAIIVPFHLINTFFLMFFLVGVPWSLKQQDKLTLNWKSLFANKYWKQFFIGIFFFFLLSISGATSALADSLFSLGDLKSELIADFSSRSHLLTRLRILHPIIAIITAGYLVFYSREIIIKVSASNMNQLLFKILCCLFVLEFIIGIFNVVLLTPILFQIIHLLFAHFVWITLTIFIFEGLKTRGIE